MATPTVTTNALHPQLNAAVAVFAGAYLLVVMWQGNLGALAAQAKTDLIGGTSSNQPGFWRWALALIILIFITELGPVRPYSGMIIGFVLVAMLIQMESSQPGTFHNLQSSVAILFGRGGNTAITGTPAQ